MDKKIIKSLKEYKKKISHDIKVKQMIFFGSRAKGKLHKYSDIDLIIVSPEFKKQRYIHRSLDLYRKWNLDFPVDLLCYTPQEIKERKKAKWGVIQEAMKTGIEI